MTVSLYRKYRPQTFVEVVDQAHITQTLANEIKGGSLAHAYIFAGPRGVGKTTLARLVAKAANCEKRKEKDHEPCNECYSCEQVNSGASVDVIEMDAASHTGVDMVRDAIIETVRFAPQRGKYKVFIIDEVHMLSTSAFNALLKTLEEPPEHAIFVLATTEIHKLPETILSRCQRFDFSKVSFESLGALLRDLAKKEEHEIDDEVVGFLCSKSGGYVRDALSLLGQVLTVGKKKIALEDIMSLFPVSSLQDVTVFVEHLARQHADEAIRLVNKVHDHGQDLVTFTESLLQYFRRALMVVVGAGTIGFGSQDEDDHIEKMRGELSVAFLQKALQVFSETLVALKRAHIPQLPLELAVLQMCPEPKQGGTGGESGGSGAAEEVAPKKEEAGAQEEEQSNIVKLSVDIETVRQKWPVILEQFGDDPSLQLLLKVVYPVKVHEDHIELACEYSFHLEQLEDVKLRSPLEKALASVFGGKVLVRGVVLAGDAFKAAKESVMKHLRRNKPTEEETPKEDLMDKLMADFGGGTVTES